jgi:hypothetical protein
MRTSRLKTNDQQKKRIAFSLDLCAIIGKQSINKEHTDLDIWVIVLCTPIGTRHQKPRRVCSIELFSLSKSNSLVLRRCRYPIRRPSFSFLFPYIVWCVSKFLDFLRSMMQPGRTIISPLARLNEFSVRVFPRSSHTRHPFCKTWHVIFCLSKQLIPFVHSETIIGIYLLFSLCQKGTSTPSWNQLYPLVESQKALTSLSLQSLSSNIILWLLWSGLFLPQRNKLTRTTHFLLFAVTSQEWHRDVSETHHHATRIRFSSVMSSNIQSIHWLKALLFNHGLYLQIFMNSITTSSCVCHDPPTMRGSSSNQWEKNPCEKYLTSAETAIHTTLYSRTQLLLSDNNPFHTRAWFTQIVAKLSAAVLPTKPERRVATAPPPHFY